MPVLEKKSTNDAALPEEGKKAAKVRGKLPDKRTINLATVNQQKINWLLALPLILLIVVVAAAFAKFAVMDRYDAVNRAQGEVSNLENELLMYNTKIESFGELNDIYGHYTYSDMTEEELTRADRVAMMDLIERVVTPNTPADGWRVSGNQMSIDINGRTLQEINVVVQLLLAEDEVAFCNVNTAKTNEKSDQPVLPAPAVIGENGEELPPAPVEEPDSDAVTANIVVQFSGKAQVE
ncbi:MAG: hypothetical protein E7474_12970 [Ruminococcaceae bacterium]|nr:hypothetical protein [Oscillospiraceae bacterium]